MATATLATRLIEGPQCINRGTEQLEVFSSFGDKFILAISEEPTVELVKQEASARLGLSPRDISVRQAGAILRDGAVVDTATPVELSYELRGGGNAGLTLETSFPALCRFDFLCWKCGVGSLPGDVMRETWCESHLCCCFNRCGPNDCVGLQVLCLRCWPNPSVDTTMPHCLTIKILCEEFGVDRTRMDMRRDDWMSNKLCCIFSSCGLTNWQECQLLCVRCTF
ncbi:unnamed protein product [Phaeothamnion confervicola]